MYCIFQAKLKSVGSAVFIHIYYIFDHMERKVSKHRYNNRKRKRKLLQKKWRDLLMKDIQRLNWNVSTITDVTKRRLYHAFIYIYSVLSVHWYFSFPCGLFWYYNSWVLYLVTDLVKISAVLTKSWWSVFSQHSYQICLHRQVLRPLLN